MTYEVEQKFKVDDPQQVVERLERIEVELGEPQEQRDQYFRHPARDFAQTDEALRVRREGSEALITYKGPKVDQQTKTRREIELPLAGDPQGQQWTALLDALDFKPVLEVVKHRRKFKLAWDGHEVDGALDVIDRLGTFVELELAAEEDGLDTARQVIASLARELGLSQNERRSYLELLLEKINGSQ